MPFVFLFDAADVLTRADTLFTDGNCGANPSSGGDADFFCALPFEKIYHASSLGDAEKRQIVFHRCAEVLVPGALGLGSLRRVWCRSPAEYETLLNTLSPKLRTVYSKMIGHGAQLETHFRFWTYVEQVSLEWNRITFRFNPSSKTPGPFNAVVTISSPQHGTLEALVPDLNTSDRNPFVISVTQFEYEQEYDVSLTLDGNQAYYGHFRPEAVVGLMGR